MANLEISSDKQNLVKTLARYDETVKVEDVVDTGWVPQLESNTLLLQILLEIACRNCEPNQQKRQMLFLKMWNKLTEAQLISEPTFHIDALFSVRSKAATEFEKEIIKENMKIKYGPLQSLLYDQNMEDSLKKDASVYEERYKREFEELQRIGRGGFGTVWKARHKIDDVIYAVKKILFKYKKDSDYVKVMREVKSFATLSHLNVVRYNQAWLEYVRPCGLESETMNNSSIDISDSEEKGFNENQLKFTQSDKSFSESRCRISDQKKSSDELVNFWHDSCLSKRSLKFSNYSGSSSTSRFTRSSSGRKTKCKDISQAQCAFHKSPILRVGLYIQMEYCDFDLRAWLNERSKDSNLPFQLEISEIFRDILNGVAHIHSKSIIHRDLKPQNIFYSAKNNCMKIGDFGLATLSDSILETYGPLSPYHSSNCGTLPYAAPEQRSRHKYDSKVDMYSLGIILLELLMDSKTHMEFNKVLNCIQHGTIPEKLITDWPEYVNLVLNLVSKDPDVRLSAKSVLSSPPLIADLEIEQGSLKEIERLKEALAEKDKRIRELETLLSRQVLDDQDKRIKELENLLNIKSS